MKNTFEISDLLVSYLAQLNVDYVFGVPGGAIEPLYNALARSERIGGPRAIVSRHETSAAFMAGGYTQTSGKLGVCCSTTGPGATNLITGVSSAKENNIPMLVITAQTPLPTLGKGAFQESSSTGVDIVRMFEHCTCYSSLVTHVDQVEQKLNTAIMKAFQTSSPAHLCFPLDVFRSPSPKSHPSWNVLKHTTQNHTIDLQATQMFYEKILNAKKVVFVLGNNSKEGSDTIQEVATVLGAQIVTTPQGKEVISSYHPLFRGVFGFAGHSTAVQVLKDPEVDLIVAVGTSMSEWETNKWSPYLLNDQLIHVDSNESNFLRSPMAQLHVKGHINDVFKLVLEHVKRNSNNNKTITDFECQFELNEASKYIDNSTPIKPQRLMNILSQMFPSTTQYLADIGSSFAWAIHYLHPSGKCKISVDFASMGWAIGNSIGVSLVDRNHPVVCITGDGSFLMNGQEITVAVQEQLPIVFVILNDGALGMVKHGQRLANAEQTGFELPRVDFAQIAKGLGVKSYTVESPDDLTKIDIEQIYMPKGPILIDVHVDPEEVPPISMRMEGLQTETRN